MNSRFIPLLLLVALALQLAGCSAQQPSVTLAGKRFTVEIADDNQERARGMMFREHLDADRGMLFIFPDMAPRSFWMKNCKIALDILYFDADLKLVSVAENAKPCRTAQCRSYPSDGPAKYVLELNGGTSSELGVSKGDMLQLHNITP